MQLKRGWVVAVVIVVAIIAVVALVAYTDLLSPTNVDRPTAPASVAAIRSQWGYDILLPTYLPTCLAYQQNGATIDSGQSAGTARVLRVDLESRNTPSCTAAKGSSIRIEEAPTLDSLTGDVTTVTQGRMQFARVSRSTTGGQQEITLQWHCASIMCRMSGTASFAVTEQTLAKMADSFQYIKP